MSTHPSYLKSTPGRLLLATIGLVAAAGAVVSLMPEGGAALRVMIWVPLVAIVMAIFAVGLSALEGFERQAVIALVLFPFGAFAWFMATTQMIGSGVLGAAVYVACFAAVVFSLVRSPRAA